MTPRTPDEHGVVVGTHDYGNHYRAAVTPRTEAGQRLLRTLDYISARSQDTSFPMAEEDIAAIEREAVEAYAARLRDNMPGTPKRHENDANGNWFTTDMEYGWDCAIAAVLDLIKREKQ